VDALFHIATFVCGTALAGFLYLEFFSSEAVRSWIVRTVGPFSTFSNDRYISLRTFSECERRLTGVSRVVVVCERVERPTSKLAEAVLDNFAEGIKYEFFIAKETLEVEEQLILRQYRDWFAALFDAAMIQRPRSASATTGLKFDDLFSVRVISARWHGPPYVFHISDISGSNAAAESEVVRTYRGLQLRRGISLYYVKVALPEAMGIISLCAAASKDFREAVPIDVSKDGSKVILLSDHQRIA